MKIFVSAGNISKIHINHSSNVLKLRYGSICDVLIIWYREAIISPMFVLVLSLVLPLSISWDKAWKDNMST